MIGNIAKAVLCQLLVIVSVFVTACALSKASLWIVSLFDFAFLSFFFLMLFPEAILAASVQAKPDSGRAISWLACVVAGVVAGIAFVLIAMICSYLSGGGSGFFYPVDKPILSADFRSVNLMFFAKFVFLCLLNSAIVGFVFSGVPHATKSGQEEKHGP